MKKKVQINLDEEEKDILTAFSKNKLKSIKDKKRELEIARTAAKNTLEHGVRVQIKLLGSDLLEIKKKAAFEGIPYQALITSILHKYATSHSSD